MRHPVRSLAIALVCILWLVVAAQCAHFARSSPLLTTNTNWSEFVVTGPISPLTDAITECRQGRAVVVLSSLQKPTREMEEIWAHERVHVEQMMQLTGKGVGCEQYEQWMTSRPGILLMHEAAAYCSQVRWSMIHEPDADPVWVLLDAAEGQARIFASYGEPEWVVPEKVIASYFLAVCPEALAFTRKRLKERNKDR